jgi:Protein of unknown function (DUF3108)
MKQKTQILAFVCFISVAALGNALDTIHVGDPAVNGSSLKSYKNRWKIVDVSKDGTRKERGVWTDEVTIKVENGRKIFRRIQDETSPGSHFVTINVMDLQTMTPIRSERKEELGENKIDIKNEFDGKEVTTDCTGRPCQEKLHFPEGQTNRKVELDEPIFDYMGGLWGMFFPALPLKENYDVRFPSFAETKGLVWVEIHVRGLETVDAGPGKKVQAWAVEWPSKNWVFWISKEAPYVIKLVTSNPDGSSTNYEMF